MKCHVTVDILPPHTEITTSFWKVIQSIWVIKGLSQNMISITLLFLWFAYHVNYLHQSFCLFHISHFSLFTLVVSRENKNIKFEAKVILDFCSFVFGIVIWLRRVTSATELAPSVHWFDRGRLPCSDNKITLKPRKLLSKSARVNSCLTMTAAILRLKGTDNDRKEFHWTSHFLQCPFSCNVFSILAILAAF